MENFGYLFAAYSVIWVVLFIYIFALQRQVKNIQTELEAMKKDTPHE